jgi:hypothetical protein
MQNVVNFDEIPTIKDTKTSAQNSNLNDDHNKIDFFGADLNNQNDEDEFDDNNIMSPNDFD